MGPGVGDEAGAGDGGEVSGCGPIAVGEAVVARAGGPGRGSDRFSDQPPPPTAISVLSDRARPAASKSADWTSSQAETRVARRSPAGTPRRADRHLIAARRSAARRRTARAIQLQAGAAGCCRRGRCPSCRGRWRPPSRRTSSARPGRSRGCRAPASRRRSVPACSRAPPRQQQRRRSPRRARAHAHIPPSSVTDCRAATAGPRARPRSRRTARPGRARRPARAPRRPARTAAGAAACAGRRRRRRPPTSATPLPPEYGADLVPLGGERRTPGAERDDRLEPPAAPEPHQPLGEQRSSARRSRSRPGMSTRACVPRPAKRHARAEPPPERALDARDREELAQQRRAARAPCTAPIAAAARLDRPGPVRLGLTSGSVAKRVTTGGVGSGASTTSGAGREVIASSRKLARRSSTARTDSTSAMRAAPSDRRARAARRSCRSRGRRPTARRWPDRRRRRPPRRRSPPSSAPASPATARTSAPSVQLASPARRIPRRSARRAAGPAPRSPPPAPPAGAAGSPWAAGGGTAAASPAAPRARTHEQHSAPTNRDEDARRRPRSPARFTARQQRAARRRRSCRAGTDGRTGRRRCARPPRREVPATAIILRPSASAAYEPVRRLVEVAVVPGERRPGPRPPFSSRRPRKNAASAARGEPGNRRRCASSARRATSSWRR